VAISYVTDELLAEDVRAITVFVPADAELDAGAVAQQVRTTKRIPASHECHGEGNPVQGGVEWVYVFTRPAAGGQTG